MNDPVIPAEEPKPPPPAAKTTDPPALPPKLRKPARSPSAKESPVAETANHPSELPKAALVLFVCGLLSIAAFFLMRNATLAMMHLGSG